MGNIYIDSAELYHHQVKGGKHGIRRYQDYDGTLTVEGRIHRGLSPYPTRGKNAVTSAKEAKAAARAAVKQAKEEAKIAKIKAREKAEIQRIKGQVKEETKKAEPTPLQGAETFKALNQMTDTELNDAINRLRQEETFRTLMESRAKALAPEKKEGAIKFIKKTLGEAAKAQVSDVSDYLMTKAVNRIFGDYVSKKNLGDKDKYMAERFWAQNNYAPKYAPGSEGNPYGKRDSKQNEKKDNKKN